MSETLAARIRSGHALEDGTDVRDMTVTPAVDGGSTRGAWHGWGIAREIAGLHIAISGVRKASVRLRLSG